MQISKNWGPRARCYECVEEINRRKIFDYKVESNQQRESVTYDLTVLTVENTARSPGAK